MDNHYHYYFGRERIVGRVILSMIPGPLSPDHAEAYPVICPRCRPSSPLYLDVDQAGTARCVPCGLTLDHVCPDLFHLENDR